MGDTQGWSRFEESSNHGLSGHHAREPISTEHADSFTAVIEQAAHSAAMWLAYG